MVEVTFEQRSCDCLYEGILGRRNTKCIDCVGLACLQLEVSGARAQ